MNLLRFSPAMEMSLNAISVNYRNVVVRGGGGESNKKKCNSYSYTYVQLDIVRAVIDQMKVSNRSLIKNLIKISPPPFR